MARPFRPNKVIKRTVVIKSCDRAISDAPWVVAMSASGVRIRREGARLEDSYQLSWRSVISHALIHNTRKI